MVVAHSTPEKAAAILQNQFYVALSSEFSGTQEYMAMEKLGQLHTEAEADGQLGSHRGGHSPGALGPGLPGRP